MMKVFCLSKTEGITDTVGTTKTTIKLNGKSYNALTGELLHEESVFATQKTVTSHLKSAKSSRPSHGKTMDGVFRGTSKPHVSKTFTLPSNTTPATLTALPKLVMDVHRSIKPIAHHKPEHSSTLMRKAVKKPGPTLHRTLKASTPRTDVLAKVPAHHISAKLSIRHIDEKRLRHAELIAKNQLVSRFGHVDIPKTSQHAQHATIRPKTALPSIQGISISTDPVNIRPVYAASAGTSPISQLSPSLDIFEHALAHANSHKETYISPRQARKNTKKSQRHFAKKIVSTGASILTVLMLMGFIAYQNTANITMRVASSKAGFHASMPSYKPSGFSAGNFKYSAGYVAMNFSSNSDNRAFSITQKVSNWNSATLLNEYVSNAAGKAYSTLEASGRTIYTYGNNNATWVDKGIWYNVQSEGSLSTSQLLNIASSM